MSATFETIPDRFGILHFSIPLSSYPSLLNLSEARLSGNIAGFLDPVLLVPPITKSAFSSDLTPRDDVLLAFLSLVLLLLLDAFVASILLRTHSGQISTFSISLQLVLTQFRDFRVFPLRRSSTSRINVRLLFCAIGLLSLTLILEIGILFVTEPVLHPIHNSDRTLRLFQPVLPTWDDVRFHVRASFNRPCSATTLRGVVQGATRINGCVASDIDPVEFAPFSIPESQTSLAIISRLHDYGAEHEIQVGNRSARYSARGYFRLSDETSRIMVREKVSEMEDIHMQLLHQQYLAYLFSWYNRTVRQARVTLEQVNAVTMSFETGESGEETVVEVRGDTVTSAYREYRSEAIGEIPGGVAALRLGLHFFRGITAIIVTKGNETDLFVESSREEQIVRKGKAIVWMERGRYVNWLGLGIATFGMIIGLLGVRGTLKPVAMADVAERWVKKEMRHGTEWVGVRNSTGGEWEREEENDDERGARG